MKILVINAGSSSIKYQLFEMTPQTVLASGLVERIGEASSQISHTVFQDGQPQQSSQTLTLKTHRQGLEQVVALLSAETGGVIKSSTEINAVGHRVVHGGERFSQPTLITEEVQATIKALSPLAPLHNPANLAGIEVTLAMFPAAKQVAVFDTAFHQSMPPPAYRYAIPHTLYAEQAIRVYGFHGSSHLFVSKAAAHYLAQAVTDTNLISIHLGNGCSITAVKGGQSVDTSMGFSPLAGLIMGSRSGDIDPAVLFFLGDKLGMSLADIDQLLNKQSGLFGLSGANDVRDIQRRSAAGDSQATLALDMYSYRLKKYIGAYLAVLGEVDALVFTAGVGQNSAVVRRQACAGLENLGIILDPEKNEAGLSGPVTEIQATNSPIKILIIPTNEELEIAQQTLAVISSEK